MRKLLFCAIIFSISNLCCFAADNWEKTFIGTIGRYPVEMFLSKDATKIQGEYFYIRHKKSILLRGEIEKDETCTIREFNEKGEPFAKFVGKITELNGSTFFQGTWKKIGATNVLSCSLAATSLNYKTIQSEKLPDFDRLTVSSDVQIQTIYPRVYYDYLGFFDKEDQLKYWILSNSQKDENPIFDSRGHTEVGTPISVSTAKNFWQISFIGMKVNSPTLIGNLFVTLKTEDPCGSKSQEDNQETNSLIFKKWVSAIVQFYENKAYACGCGSYISKYGSSKLIYWGETGDVQWYRLENPIPTIDTDEHRTVGLQIYFQPTGETGKIRLNLTNVILQKKGNRWAQAEVTNDDNEEFRGIIVPVEMGECDFVYDKETRNLNLEILNKGEITLNVDELSFPKLCEALSKDEYSARWTGVQLESFDRVSPLKFNIQQIHDSLRKISLKPQNKISVPLLHISNLSTKALYFPVFDFTGTIWNSVNSTVSKGRLIHWWLRSYSIISISYKGKIRGCIPTMGNDLIAFYSGVTGAAMPIIFEKVQIKDLSFDGIQYIPKNLEAFGSELTSNSFNYHWEQSDSVTGFEWGILMRETITDYLKHNPNAAAIKEMKDFYGNRIISFEKGDVLVFLADRHHDQANGIRYQIPKKWEKDSMLMSVIKWMILINPSMGF